MQSQLHKECEGILLPLVEAVFQATGLRPHLSTVIRWGSRGSSGVRLQTQFVGGKRYTTIDWVRQYVDSVTKIKNGCLPEIQSPRQQDQSAKKSAKKLADRLSRSKK